MTSFAFQVGEPHEDPNSELKATDFFDPETVGINAIPESNDDTTVTAMLEALDSNMSKAQSVIRQIQSSGKVSRSLMLETVDFYEELDTVPIKFYTEAPTAQLGEPTVESLGKWLSKAGDTALTLIEKVWKFIARYIKMAWQAGVNFLRGNAEKSNVKKMSEIVWPNSLTEPQVQYLNAWATSRNYGTFFSSFWNLSKKEGEKSFHLKYIKDFTSKGGIFTTELKNFVSSPAMGMILGVLGDANRVQDLFSPEADQQFQTVSQAMGKLKASIENAPEMTTGDYKGMVDDPNAILKFVKDYISLRKESVNGGKGTTAAIEATQQLLRKLDKFDNNVNRIKDRLGSVINQERGSDDETRISQRVNEIRELVVFVTMLQTHSVDFAKSLLTYDETILRIPSMLLKVENDTDSTQSQQNFREGMKDTFKAAYSALSLSIEDANIINYSARNTPEMNAKDGSGKTSLTQRIKDWFLRVIGWIKKAAKAASEFYHRATTNIGQRLIRYILRLQSSSFGKTWDEFKRTRIPEPVFAEALKTVLDESRQKDLHVADQGKAVFIYDLTFGNFAVVDSIEKTKAELPAMSRTLNKLGEMAKAFQNNSSPEAIIRHIHDFDPGKDKNSFAQVSTVIEKSFSDTANKMGDRLGKAGQSAFVPDNTRQFVTQGDQLRLNFDTALKKAKNLIEYAKELQYLWKRNNLDDLWRRFEELVVEEHKEALRNNQIDHNHIEAIQKMMEYLSGFMKSVRDVIEMIDNYILTIYVIYLTYESTTSKILAYAKKGKQDAFSEERLECGDSFVSPSEAMELPIESELAIETYMDQGEDSYEQQMSDGGGQQQASYLTQASDAQMEDGEQKQEDDPYKEATEAENDNPNIAVDSAKTITDPVLTEVEMEGPADASTDINDALGRLEEACGLTSKIEESEGVTRELAMEGYENFPTAMGNPTNYMKGKFYPDDRKAALESLSNTITETATKVYEWIVKAAKVVGERLKTIYEKVRRFTASYNESGVVKRIAGVRQMPMADASGFENDTLLKQLKESCANVVKDSKFVSQVLLTNPGSLSEFDINLEKILRQSSGIREVLKMAAENREIQGPVLRFDIPSLARTINEVTFAGRRVDVTDELMAKALERYRAARPSGTFKDVISRYENILGKLNTIIGEVSAFRKGLNNAKYDEGSNSYVPENTGRAPEAYGTDESNVAKSVAGSINLLSGVATQLDTAIRFIMAFDRATLQSVKVAHDGRESPAQAPAGA